MTWHGPVDRPAVTPGDGSQGARIESAVDALDRAAEEDALFLWTGGKEAQVIADLLLYTVGTGERSPVPWGVIDTGNHFEEMEAFREEYVRPTGDRGADTVGPATGVADVRIERYDALLEGVILNDDDPRDYHGRWDGTVDLPESAPVDGLPRSPEAWGVPESCGALKTVPLRRFVEDHGFDVLITGRRAADPIVAGADGEDGLSVREERRRPVPHTRVNPLADWSEANVYAYLKAESVSLPSLYTEEGYRHTDSRCCTGDDATGEYGEGGRDPRKVQARDRLNDMGYI